MITWHKFEIIFEIFTAHLLIFPRARESNLQRSQLHRNADFGTKVYVWISGLKHRLAHNIGPPGHTISIWKFEKIVLHAYRCMRSADVCGGTLLEDSDLYPYNSPRIRFFFKIRSYFFDTVGKSDPKEKNGLRMQVRLLTWRIVYTWHRHSQDLVTMTHVKYLLLTQLCYSYLSERPEGPEKYVFIQINGIYALLTCEVPMHTPRLQL